MDPYQKVFEIRWADLDPNRHLRHTAYADYATHVRFSYFFDSGFTPDLFEKEGFGPVILREETRYLKEISMGAVITIDIEIAGLAADGSRFRLHHAILKANGETAAVHRVEGGWLDLGLRKLRVPPPEIAELLHRLPRTDDFEEMPSILEKRLRNSSP